MSKLTEIFSRNLKEITEELGIRQSDIAKALDTSDPTVSNWFRGVHVPDVPVAVALAEYLDCTLDYLFRDVGVSPVLKEDKWSKERSYYLKLTEDQLAEIESLKKDKEALLLMVKELKAEKSSLYDCIQRVREAGGVIKFKSL